MKRLLPAILLGFAQNTLAETVIPIEIQYGNPIATASIGKIDVRFIVDSGGLSLGLRPETVAKLDLKQSDEKMSSTDAHGVTVESNSFSIPTMVLGGTEFSNIAGYVSPLPPPVAARTPPLDGIIGRDFLNDFIVIYDYENSTITLYDKNEQGAVACSGAAIPLVDHSERIIATKAVVDGGIVDAIWDTGATHSFIKARVAKDRSFSLEKDEQEIEFYRSTKLGVGGNEFGPLEFVSLPFVEPDNIDVYVGRNFFAEHIVCVDFLGKLLKIRANREVVKPVDRYGREPSLFSITPYYAKGQFRGYRIYAGADQEQFAILGLQSGDLLTKIHGTTISKNIPTVIQLFETLNAGNEFVLTIERGVEFTEMDIVLK